MSKPKLALVNVFFPPQAIGGATRVLADNIDLLATQHADDFQLVGFTSDAGHQAPYSMETYGHRGSRVYRAGVPRRVNMDWQPEDDRMRELFQRFLRFERPDLIHFHCVQRLTASVVDAARELGIPYLVTVHDAWWISDHQFLVDQNGIVYPNGHPDPDAPLTTPAGVSLEQSLERRAFLKGLLADAAAVHTVSGAFADIYRRNGVQGVRVIRNGVAPREWLPRIPAANGRLLLGHIGGMSRHKGFDLLRDALSTGNYPNLEALVVDLSKPHGYEFRGRWNDVPVTFVGRYPQRRIAELFARIDVLMAPSLWPESFGLVTREASSAGVWVVASDRGGIGEDIRDGLDGNVIPVDDNRALCALLNDMNDRPDHYRAPAPHPQVADVASQVEGLVQLYRCIGAQP